MQALWEQSRGTETEVSLDVFDVGAFMAEPGEEGYRTKSNA
jgi:hypothetical protein